MMHQKAREFLMINFYWIIRKTNEEGSEYFLKPSDAQADSVILEVFLRVFRCKNDWFLPLIHKYNEIFLHYHLSNRQGFGKPDKNSVPALYTLVRFNQQQVAGFKPAA